jgi:lipid-A-disaccharide synthase
LTNKKILIISGEPSGDLHASNLVRDMRSLDPSLRFYGVGGALSAKAGVGIVFDITDLALVGLVEVIRNISAVKRAHDAVIAKVRSDRPDLAILVDYPGFNLKIARDLAGLGIPVAYYISPQIWAWGMQRVHLIRRYVKKMVVFFGFEAEIYRKYGIDAECVGHPLVDTVKVTAQKADVLKRYGLVPGRPTVAILPGSRDSEIRGFLPVLAGAAGRIKEKIGTAQFFVSRRPGRAAGEYEDAFRGSGVEFRLVEGDLHNIVAASDLAIAASGTVTLETAIIGTPLIIVYRANPLTYLLYKIVNRAPFLGIVNIIAGREVAPEYLQNEMTPENISAKAVELLSDQAKKEAMRRDLAVVRASLGSPGASLRAARVILPLLN